MTKQGLPFWSGPKRFPQPIEFTLDDPESVNFVFSAANIYCHILGLEEIKNEKFLLELLKGVQVSKYEPKKNANLEQMTEQGNDKNIMGSEEDEVVAKELLAKLNCIFINFYY